MYSLQTEPAIITFDLLCITDCVLIWIIVVSQIKAILDGLYHVFEIIVLKCLLYMPLVRTKCHDTGSVVIFNLLCIMERENEPIQFFGSVIRDFAW